MGRAGWLASDRSTPTILIGPTQPWFNKTHARQMGLAGVRHRFQDHHGSVAHAVGPAYHRAARGAPAVAGGLRPVVRVDEPDPASTRRTGGHPVGEALARKGAQEHAIMGS